MAPMKKGLYEFKKDSLIEIRKRLDISQGKMAELLGIPANTLSRWETGATIPDGSSLASIYSLARELGVDMPSFFGTREVLPSIKIGNLHTKQDSIQSLSFYQDLKSYLKTLIENIGSVKNPIIKVEISSTAPDDYGLPRIVFTGVGLSLASIGRDIQSFISHLKLRTTRITRREKLETRVTPWENDAIRKGLLNVSYWHLDGTSTDFTPIESEQGVILFPGDSIIYEIDVPHDLLPYLKFRVEGNVSRYHLFRCEEIFGIPEDFTIPLAVSALKDFNSLDIHKLLPPVTESIIDFANNPQSFELRKFKILLSEKINEAQAMQDIICNDFRQHSLNWFRAHLRSTHIYLDIVKESLKRLKEATESADSDSGKTAAEASTILSLKNMASQLNRETEGLMDMFNISDEEVGYRYRGMT